MTAPMWGVPKREFPTQTLREWCETFRRLDREYGTPADSPLHHDSGRCPLHPAVSE